MAQTPINHIIFWMNVMRTFSCTYVIYFKTDWSLLLRLEENCKKCTFLDNLRAITQEANIEIKQITPFFSPTFSLHLFATFIFVFENSQNSFSCCPTFGPFWSVKYLYFGQKLPIRKVYAVKLLKIHIMFCLPRGAKKKRLDPEWIAR